MQYNFCPQCGDRLQRVDALAKPVCPHCGTVDLPRAHKINPNRSTHGIVIFAILSLLVITVLAIPLAVLPAYQKQTATQTLQNAQSDIEKTAKAVTDHYVSIEQSVVNLSEVLLAELEVNPENNAVLLSHQSAFLADHPEAMNVYIGLADKSMLLVPEQALPEDYDPTGRPWYQDALTAKALAWSPFYQDASNGTMICTIATPIFPMGDTVKAPETAFGVLGIDVSLDALFTGAGLGAADTTKPYTLTIVDGQGFVQYQPDVELIGQPIPYPELAKAIAEEQEGLLHYQGPQGKVVARLFKIADTPYTLIATLNYP